MSVVSSIYIVDYRKGIVGCIDATVDAECAGGLRDKVVERIGGKGAGSK